MAACSCGLGSKIPLRCQFTIVFVVCAVLCLVLPPIIMGVWSSKTGESFEEKIAIANGKRGVATMYKTLVHEEEVLVAYSVWDDMANATDELLYKDNEEEFISFLESEFYDFGLWSEWTCGNLLAVYNKSSFEEPATLIWSEYHPSDPSTLEIDQKNAAPTPSIFLGETEESKKFLEEMTSGESQSGFIALDDEVLVVSCQPIIHSETGDTPHGFLCRATDIHTYLESISAGAGACVSVFNMANPSQIPKDIRKELDDTEIGSRVNDTKFDGEYVLSDVKTADWDAPSWPNRMCGPAEMLNANSSQRTLMYFRLENDFTVLSDPDQKNRGIGFLFDSDREVEPIFDESFLHSFIFLEVFGVIMFVVFGLFVEFAVLRKLDIIASAAYESLVAVEEKDEFEDDYYTKSSTRDKKKKDKEDLGKNKIVRMATVAIQTLQKNEADLKKRKNDLIVEKMRSSLAADKLRLISLFCENHEDGLVPSLMAKNGGRRMLPNKRQIRKSRSIFFQDLKQERSDVVTLETVMNDPFALELFKSYSVTDSLSHKVRHPARRCLLFLLSVFYYRSLSKTTTRKVRLDCMTHIIDEFFVTSKTSTTGLSRHADDDIGVPESIRAQLVSFAGRCVAHKRPRRDIFDDACSAVRSHLSRNVFPGFMKTPAFSIIKRMRQENYHLNQTFGGNTRFDPFDNGTAEDEGDGHGEGSLARQELREMDNTTDGTVLSRKVFHLITKDSDE